jgi:hypothetical protein
VSASGVFHLPILLVSGGEPLQLVQVDVAAITGVALHLFRHRWGFILTAMIAQGIWDMSAFLSATNELSAHRQPSCSRTAGSTSCMSPITA